MWAILLQDYNFCNHVPRMNLQIAVATLAHVSTTIWRIELATYRTPMLVICSTARQRLIL